MKPLTNMTNMRNMQATAFLLLSGLLLTSVLGAQERKPPIRAAVIGGMTISGMWQDLSAAFEKDTGWQIKTVVTGPKEVLRAVVQTGEADLVTLHSSDEAADMVARGWMRQMRPWARNEHCILGPVDDPAGIRGLTDGAAALRRIAETQSPLVDFSGPGSREVAHRLWKKAGIRPSGDWLLQDATVVPQEIARYAASRRAYVIVGRIPVLKGKIPADGMEVMVQGDPDMRRPYVVMEADPEKFPNANAAGAKVLADWLAGAPGQAFLREFAKSARTEDGPLFFPADPGQAQ